MMRRLTASLTLSLASLFAAGAPDGASAAFVSFETKEIDKSLTIGYAVLPVDINRDGKPDVVVVDKHRVVWYENPTWKRRTVIDKTTQPDNVCVAAHDIDGDGRVDLALGAGWNPGNTRSGGTLQWLRQPESLEEPWKLYPIAEEPTLHRIRFADLDGSGKPALLVGPLFGRNSTTAKNWMDAPLRLLAYRIPKDPTKDRWVAEVLDESLHVMHNFHPLPAKTGKGMDVLTASYDGVHRLTRDGDRWAKRKLGTGNQDTPAKNRGASEIKLGTLKGGVEFIATIEPWHGHQVVVYTPPAKEGDLWRRQVLDDQLRWGHAVWCADLDGDGGDELVIGVRDDLSKKSGQRCGVRVYKALDAKGERWGRTFVDEGGVAVEDLACADFDGDGKVDVVAVGRATKNLRLYRNVGRK